MKKAPKRPKNISEEAYWVEKWNEWVLLVKGDKKQGTYRSWWSDGVLCGECEGYYKGDDFIINGNNKRFHDNGDIASIGRYKHGDMYSCTWYRKIKPSREPGIPPELGEDVWSVEQEFNKGIVMRSKYFTKSGKEVDFYGKNIPKRPKNVPENAEYKSKDNFWHIGNLVRSTSKRIGIWKWWNKDGNLLREEDYDNDICIIKRDYFESGNLRREEKDGGKIVLEYYETGELHREKKDGGNTKLEYYKTGELRSSIKKEKNKSKYTYFYKNGQISSQGNFGAGWDDYPSGVWKFYDEQGNIIIESDLSPLMLQPKKEEELLKYAKIVEEIRGMPTLEVLKGINEIDWENTYCCWPEFCKYFPLYLKGITSDNQEVFNLAYGELSCQIQHQGTIYEATAKVMPFLVKLVGDKNFKWKSKILKALPRLASGSSYLEAHQHMCLLASERAKPDFEERLEKELKDVYDTYMAVVSGSEIYTDLINSETPEFREYAAILLAIAPEDLNKSKDVLFNRLKIEKDESINATIIIGLGLILSQEDDKLEILSSLIKEEKGLIQYCAALSLLRIQKGNVDNEVIKVILKAIKNPKEIDNDYQNLYWADGSVIGDASLAISDLNKEDKFEIVPILADSIDTVDALSSLNLVEAMLQIVFGENSYDENNKLTKLQKIVINSIANSEKAWIFNVNLHEILDWYDLPRDQEELKKISNKP